MTARVRPWCARAPTSRSCSAPSARNPSSKASYPLPAKFRPSWRAGSDGHSRVYDLCENHHAGGILATTTLPASVKPETEQAAADLARRIADALDYVGVLTVELFLVPGRDGGAERLVVNEIAPRVHNSGHWTLGGAVTSQFEQHVRAICGWPLGETRRWGAIEMRNLIGDDVQAWRSILSEPGASLHVYGKTAPRPGRKMGHVTVVRPHEPA